MGFLDIFKKKQAKKNSVKKEENIKIEKLEIEYMDESNEILNNKIDKLIRREILNVIQYHDNFEELRARAEIAAYSIGKEHIDLLPEYLNSKIDQPIELGSKYETLAEWSMVVENSVLMIIFSYRENSIDILTSIAYGDTKVRLKAINLLIRLASEGVATDRIIDDIMNNIMEFNNDEKLIIFGFASKLKGNKKIIALIQHFYKEFLKAEDVERAYKVLIYLINVAQRCTNGHLNFLKFIAMDNKEIDLKQVIDIEEGEKDIVPVGDIDEISKIRAALTFYSINQEDEDINNILIYCSENYDNEEIKSEIKKLFEIKKLEKQ